MRIHKAGKGNAPSEINLFYATCGIVSHQIGAAANCSDPSLADKNRAITDYPEIAKLLSAVRRSSAECQQFRAASDEDWFSHSAAIIAQRARIWDV